MTAAKKQSRLEELRDKLGYVIQGNRVVFDAGSSRTATPEEMRAWQALTDGEPLHEGDTPLQAAEDGEPLNHYDMVGEVNSPVSFAREVTHPTPQEAITRGSGANKHVSPEELQKRLKARDEEGERVRNGGQTQPTRASGLAEGEFASGEAYQEASESGLTMADFDGYEPSGANGYTKADVQQVVKEKESGDE